MTLNAQLAESVGGKRKLELIAVYITKEKKEALEAWAASEERSVSWIVSKMIDRGLQERQNKSGSNQPLSLPSLPLAPRDVADEK